MVITYVEDIISFNSFRSFLSPTKGCSDSRTVENTFRYILSQTEKGIFIKIHDNKLVNFIVFNVIDHFENLWNEKIKVDERYFKNINEFLKHVARKTRAPFNPNFVEQNIKLWRCNNGLLRYELPRSDSRKNIECIHDMFQELCKHCCVENVEFFFNKRDFPIKRMGLYEPFQHIWDSKRYPLQRERHQEYSPILSVCSEPDFVDIASPTYEDWARARESEDGVRFEDSRVGKVFEPVQWDNKIAKAVFRGSSTGIGTTSENNVRMKLVRLCEKFPVLFDAGFTKISYRPRKQYKNPFLQTIEEKFKCLDPLSLQEQVKYKFIINVEGHSAAFRLSSELLSGSCVLLVQSKWDFWLYSLIEPYKHYVPVKSDLSDLITQIRWCLDNDDKCKEIAENSKELEYGILSKQGILTFLKDKLNSFQKTVIYNHRDFYRHDPNKTKEIISKIQIPGVEFASTNKDSLSGNDEITLFVNLVLWHAEESFKFNWGHDKASIVSDCKKTCLSFLIDEKWYQIWTSLKICWPPCENTNFIFDDVWYGPLNNTFENETIFETLRCKKLDRNAKLLMTWAAERNIPFRRERCVAKIDNRLFQNPVFLSQNVFLLSYYCINIFHYIPKSAKTSEQDDATWKRWQDTLSFLKIFFSNNIEQTKTLPLKFEIYSFPNFSKEKLCDYTKWNRKIKNVINYEGHFELSEENKIYYKKLFQPLFQTTPDYSYRIASHNAVLGHFENTR